VAYLAILKHAVKYGAVCLSRCSEIETRNLIFELALITWRNLTQKRQVLCRHVNNCYALGLAAGGTQHDHLLLASNAVYVVLAESMKEPSPFQDAHHLREKS
jgi:hypothetical protein